MRKIILGFFVPLVLLAQNFEFSEAEQLQGYARRDGHTYFLFDAGIYGVKPQQVILEGGMRNWDHDLSKKAWHLKQTDNPDLWILKFADPEMKKISPHTPFKFRINDGDWMSPPENAPNLKGGNLIFAHNEARMRVEAEIAGKKDIRLIFPDAKPDYTYQTDAYMLWTAAGEEVPLERVFYIRPGVLQIVPKLELDRRRLHYLQVNDLNIKVPVTYDGWFRHFYSDAELGANFYEDENATIIRLFAPRADSVFVFLYLNPDDDPASVTKMQLTENGIWETRFQGNWEGWYYDFTAYGPDEPGNHFYQTNPVHFSDPRGRVSVDSHGPCRIWPKTEPATPLKNGIPPMQDVIAYEVHIQDFTRNLPLPDSLKGTFKGFATRGLKNKNGEKIGFDHLLELGVNVLHLMPVQEYLHYPDAEWQTAFWDDPYMISQGINEENYQWGYRTSHAFALESRYRIKGSEHGSQNEDFRDLIELCHQNGIAVIVDVVFNHTAERMDNRQYYFNFSAIDVPYFYRTDDKLNYIGEYGTETKSEERPMMQRWIIEQCTDMIDQYGIDGFRIDIAGQTDQQTLKALRETLGKDNIVYGEPWINSADPDYENNPDWDWYKIDAPFTFFQDDARNAFKGPTANPKDKETDRGYAGGNGDRAAAMKALAAGFPEDKTPLAGINYLDIHDNWALADRFAETDWDGRFGVEERHYKIAATLLFTSPGPIVLHGGSELMRSKGVAPLQEIIKYTETGPIYIHGKRDTYNLARANAFIWDLKGFDKNRAAGVHCNYKNMYDFWRGLIALRKSDYGAVFRIAEKPDNNYYRWILPENEKLLGYIVDEKIMVLINTDKQAGRFENVELPAGNWRLIADTERVEWPEGINDHPLSDLEGNMDYAVMLDAVSLKMWVRR